MLKDILKRDRSYRSFDESATFTEEQLAAFVEHTRYAPASVNMQPLKYRLIFEEEEVQWMRPLTKWARNLPELTLPPKGHHATAFIIICHDKTIAPNADRFMKDVGICAHTIMLAATEAGFGGCMIGNFSPAKVVEAFSLPETLQPMLVLALGKPDEEITLVPMPGDGNFRYYRDENGRHYVPKRGLDELLIK